MVTFVCPMCDEKLDSEDQYRGHVHGFARHTEQRDTPPTCTVGKKAHFGTMKQAKQMTKALEQPQLPPSRLTEIIDILRHMKPPFDPTALKLPTHDEIAKMSKEALLDKVNEMAEQVRKREEGMAGKRLVTGEPDSEVYFRYDEDATPIQKIYVGSSKTEYEHRGKKRTRQAQHDGVTKKLIRESTSAVDNKPLNKVDCADARGLNEFRKLCNSRKLKGSPFFHSMELSALENVNVTELLYGVATSVDRKRGKLKLAPYSVALNSHDDRRQAIRQEFDSFISTSMESGDSTWQIFLQRPGVAMHPTYLAFIAQFGPREAERVFKTWAKSAASVDKRLTPTRLLMCRCGEGCSTIVVVDDETSGKSVPHASANSPTLGSPRRDGEECSTLSSHHSSPASSISYGGRQDETSRPSPPHPLSGWPPRKQRPAPPPPPPKPTRCELAMSQSIYSGSAESQASSYGASRSRSSRDAMPSVKTRTGRSRSVAPTPERAALVESARSTNDPKNARETSACRRPWGTSKPGRGLLSRTKSQYAPTTSSTDANSKKAGLNETQLNTFVTKCIEYIESNGGLEVEGIYRVPGSRTQMAALEKKFKKPASIDLAAMHLPVQAVATALKRYLDLLPEPLVGPLTHADALQSLVEHSSREELTLLKELVEQNIPASNILPLANLLHHLWRVHLNSHLNAMDCRNLAKVWSPTLFRPTFESFEAMATSLSQFETATYVLLTRCNAIFSLGDV